MSRRPYATAWFRGSFPPLFLRVKSTPLERRYLFSFCEKGRQGRGQQQQCYFCVFLWTWPHTYFLRAVAPGGGQQNKADEISRSM